VSKKRWVTFCLLAVLILGLLAPSVHAEETVYFTAVNNTLLELSSETMPVVHNSMIYVPCEVFNTRSLSLWAYYSKGGQTALISDGSRELHFDMSAGNSTDRDGNLYQYAALYLNDTAYVPVFFVTDYFGLGYSYIRREGWHIVRITTGGALSDEEFFSAAAPLLETRLNQYLGYQDTPAPTLSPGPEITPTPSLPPPTETPAPIVDRSGVRVHLCFLGLGEGSAAILDALGETPACFFATEEEIYDHADLTRRILGSGNTVGLRIRRNAEDEYEDFCQALRDTAMTVSFLGGAAVEDGEEALERWAGLGIPLLVTEQPLVTLRACAGVLASAWDRCDLMLDGNFGDVEGLLRLLKEDQYTLEAVTEVTAGR
jgi:hypothetical protein